MRRPITPPVLFVLIALGTALHGCSDTPAVGDATSDRTEATVDAPNDLPGSDMGPDAATPADVMNDIVPGDGDAPPADALNDAPSMDASGDAPSSDAPLADASGDATDGDAPTCRVDGDCPSGLFCGADAACHLRVCTPGATTCVDATRLRVCDARGAAMTETPCATTEVCAAGRCQPRVCTPGEASCTAVRERRACNTDGTAFVTATCTSTEVCAAGACVPCPDADADGVSDTLEGAPSTDTDRDGTPDFRDTDSDGDGFLDAVEAGRLYPGFEAMGRALTCGAAPDNCDASGDSVPNLRDTDSDNDGLSDDAERAARTNPCAEDTDGDGASDLVEVRAGSDPTSAGSRLPASALVVALPHRAATHEHRELTAAARVRAADVFFLVDNSTSVQPVIDQLRAGFTASIAPALAAAIPDLRVGVGSFDSMPVPPQGCPGRAGPPAMSVRCDPSPTTAGDYTLWMRQALTSDVAAAQRAFDAMRTIDMDTGGAFYGGDEPECQTEAAFQVLEGLGSRGHESDALALLSVRNALDPAGDGWVPAAVPTRDCGVADRFGWGCFAPGRVPLLVLVSDANWYDGCAATSPTTPGGVGRTCADLSAALVRRGAWFVGVDVGVGVDGRTYNNALPLARATGSVDASGAPVVLGVGSSGLATLPSRLVAAVTTLTSQSRSDVTARVTADPTETRLPAGRSTADFVRAVTPTRAMPEAPDGYTRRDATSFVGVAPSTSLVFDLDLFNDFAPGADGARVFVATVQVLGRASSVLESRTLYLVVPAAMP